MKHDANAAVPETLETSLHLALRLLEAIHIPTEKANQIIQEIREEDYAALKLLIPETTT